MVKNPFAASPHSPTDPFHSHRLSAKRQSRTTGTFLMHVPPPIATLLVNVHPSMTYWLASVRYLSPTVM